MNTLSKILGTIFVFYGVQFCRASDGVDNKGKACIGMSVNCEIKSYLDILENQKYLLGSKNILGAELSENIPPKIYFGSGELRCRDELYVDGDLVVKICETTSVGALDFENNSVQMYLKYEKQLFDVGVRKLKSVMVNVTNYRNSDFCVVNVVDVFGKPDLVGSEDGAILQSGDGSVGKDLSFYNGKVIEYVFHNDDVLSSVKFIVNGYGVVLREGLEFKENNK